MAKFYQNSDLYYPFRVKIKSGSVFEDNIVGIEFTVGDIEKLYPSEYIKSNEVGLYLIRFTQEETLGMTEGVIPVQARVKFKSGNVIPTNIIYADVKKTLSKKVWGE